MVFESKGWTDLVHLVEESNSYLPQIKGKNIKMLLGPGGAGKSTTIHFLNGNAMTLQSGEKIPQLKNPLPTEFEKIEIGSESKLKTKYLSVVDSWPAQCKAEILVDTPGFSFTEETAVDVGNMISLTNILKHCSHAFLILLIPFTYLTVERDSLGKLLHFVHSLFRSTNDISPDSLLVAFTHVPESRDQSPESTIKAALDSVSCSYLIENECTDAVNVMLDIIVDEIGVHALNPFQHGAAFKPFRALLKDGLSANKFQQQLPSHILEFVRSNLKHTEETVSYYLNFELETLSAILEAFVSLKDYIPDVGESLRNCCNQVETWVDKTGQDLISQFQSSMVLGNVKKKLCVLLCWFKEKLKEMGERNLIKHLKPELMNENDFTRQIINKCWEFAQSVTGGPERTPQETEAKRSVLLRVQKRLPWNGLTQILEKTKEFAPRFSSARAEVRDWVENNQFSKLQQWLGLYRDRLETLIEAGEVPVVGWLQLAEKIQAKYAYKSKAEAEVDANTREREQLAEQIKTLQRRVEKLEIRHKQLQQQIQIINEIGLEAESVALLGRCEAKAITKLHNKMENPYFMEALDFEDVSTVFSMFEMDALFARFKKNDIDKNLEVTVVSSVAYLQKHLELEFSEAVELQWKLKLLENKEKGVARHLSKCRICASNNLSVLLREYGMNAADSKEIEAKMRGWKGYFLATANPANAAEALKLTASQRQKFTTCLVRIQRLHNWLPEYD